MMLRECLVLALAAVSLASAISETQLADRNMLIKQKKFYDLFMYIQDPFFIDAEWYEIGKNYDVMANIDYYTNKEVVMDFMTHYKLGMLRKDSLFTLYNEAGREEMYMLYRLFYYAKDFSTFYKTACFARVYLNPGVFAIAFTAATYYREDTRFIKLPAIYEIFPNMFFDSRLVRDAQRLMMTYGKYGQPMKSTENVETFYLYSNFTEVCLNPMHSYEYKMMYFTEDVGLNAFYYYFRMMFPFWMNSKEYHVLTNFRGEFYYFFHQQLMSRYYLERFSHGLGELEDFSFDSMSLPGFYSDYVYFNGVSMPRRDWWNFVPFYRYHYVEYIKMLETRIMEAIDSGFVIDEMGKSVNIMCPEGLNILANIIEGNYDSVNLKYYGSYDAYFRRFFGMYFDAPKDFYIPTAMEYFSTSMKDPAFYRMYNRIMFFFYRYKYLLPRYTRKEVEFTGVKFENVEFDNFYTFFDKREYLVNNLVDVPTMKDGRSFHIKTWQYHLNYKPFTFKFAVSSERSAKAVMRIFLGPAIDGYKYDDYDYFHRYYKYFFMLDHFEFQLHDGMNTFERKFAGFSDYMTGDRFYHMMMSGIEGREGAHFPEHMYSFPEYLRLPRGSPGGMRFKLFFFIDSFDEGKYFDLPFFGKFMYNGKPFNFPMDRPMYPWFFSMGNVFFKSVYIYHQPMSDYSYEGAMHYPMMHDSMYGSSMMQNYTMDYSKVLRRNRERYMNMMQDIKKSRVQDFEPSYDSTTMRSDFYRMRDFNMMPM